MNKHLLKKLTAFIICSMVFSANSFAQWTASGANIFNSNTGKVGIGTGAITMPGTLTVKGSGGTPVAAWANSGLPIFTGFGEQTVGNADFILAQASSLFNARPVFIGRRAKGTLAAPSIVANNDYLMSFLASGYDGSGFQNPAAIDFYVDGSPLAGSVPARISFVTGSNSATRAERLKIGSTGNIFFNNNQLTLTQATGRVGIGTSTPGAKLDIVGSGNYDLSGAYSDFRLGDATYNLKMGVANAGGGAGDAYIAGSGRLYLGTSNTFANSIALAINPDGTVGVGSYITNGKFTVNGDPASASPTVYVKTNFTSASDVRGISVLSKTADGYGYGVEATGGYYGGYFFGDGGAYSGGAFGVRGIASGTAGTRYGVYGDASGGADNWGGYFPTKTYTNDLRVGGTAGATGYVAAINGKLIATEVRVALQANWPDYVFHPSYNLMSLDELEIKLKSDFHLPGVPSAEEMNKGINVSEMQTKTMEKVEENTLYILQLNNRIKDLENKIEQLTKLIK